jgi:hypothetical protein
MNHRAFLVIGAMKAGTTSLFRDLAQNPSICLPEKEPAYLVRHDTPRAAAAYRNLFRGVRPGQIVGEASTGYSMLPRFPGVAQRAVECLGPDLKILYLVRNPIHRALSHHYHAMSYGEAPRDPAAALREGPHLLAVSRYAMQLDPWREAFPAGQILVIVAEEYYAARNDTLDRICRFLEVPNVPVVESDRHNQGEERRVGRWNAVRRWGFYRRHIAPRIPSSMRARASGVLLSPGPPRPRPPDVDCLQHLCDALIPDVETLTRFMGRSAAPWDLADTVRRLAQLAAS